MEKSLLIAVYGTFGHPNGFTQSLYGKTREIGKIETFDIRTTAIKLFKGTKMYRLRKEKVGGSKVFSFAKYSYAKEKNSSRGGTFVGVGVLGVNRLPEVSQSLSILDKFLYELMNNPNNIQEERIMVSHSKEYEMPDMGMFVPLMDCVSEPVEDVKFIGEGEELLIFSESVSNKEDLIRLIVDCGLELLSDYDSIYFTSSEEISKYTYNKNIIEVVDEALLQNKMNIIKQKRKKECDKIIEKAKSWIDDFKEFIKNREEKIKHLKKIHQENESRLKSFEDESEKINSIVEESFQKIEKISESLVSVKFIPKNAQIKKAKEELLKITKVISEEIGTDDTMELQEIEISEDKHRRVKRLEPQTTFPVTNEDGYLERASSSNKQSIICNKAYQFGIIVLLFLLVLCGGIYFWLSKGKAKADEIQKETMENTNQLPIQKKDSINSDELKPSPNAEISANDLNVLNKIISQQGKNVNADSVVEVIFRKNPKEIDAHYKDQKDNYKYLLIKMNEHLFSNGVLTDAKLEKVPCYRK
ncbi:hypothetical protein EDL98_09470 [Ornithobacterium rhinotracheale]|uniref:hypothetical protein n=1 Tax=Ornithobacterium rhinotracheale TaxID=28251 RepID=UPI00129C874D|nr:hypothetical protein [Ornithobacterium rhinotracheale]MRJ11300.1 hypothetical protein [Ornithobacterium rhinotracheale]